jgi:Cu(I)/Ag(I) efflux system periplasmic protein CusF
MQLDIFLTGVRSMKLLRVMVAVLLSAACASMSQAQTNAAKSQTTATMARGTVVAVDMENKRILLRHGPIPSLHMGSMTMEFGVQDAKLLLQLKKGSKLRFTAVQQGDDYLITRLQVLK